MAKKSKTTEPQLVGFLGVGLDNADGEHRITRSEHFFIIGGSKETHGRMQETAIKFDEGLNKRGKVLQETPIEEIKEIFLEAQDD